MAYYLYKCPLCTNFLTIADTQTYISERNLNLDISAPVCKNCKDTYKKQGISDSDIQYDCTNCGNLITDEIIESWELGPPIYYKPLCSICRPIIWNKSKLGEVKKILGQILCGVIKRCLLSKTFYILIILICVTWYL